MITLKVYFTAYYTHNRPLVRVATLTAESLRPSEGLNALQRNSSEACWLGSDLHSRFSMQIRWQRPAGCKMT